MTLRFAELFETPPKAWSVKDKAGLGQAYTLFHERFCEALKSGHGLGENTETHLGKDLHRKHTKRTSQSATVTGEQGNEVTGTKSEQAPEPTTHVPAGEPRNAPAWGPAGEPPKRSAGSAHV